MFFLSFFFCCFGCMHLWVQVCTSERSLLSICVFVTFNHPMAQISVVIRRFCSSWRRKHWRLIAIVETFVWISCWSLDLFVSSNGLIDLPYAYAKFLFCSSFDSRCLCLYLNSHSMFIAFVISGICTYLLTGIFMNRIKRNRIELFIWSELELIKHKP